MIASRYALTIVVFARWTLTEKWLIKEGCPYDKICADMCRWAAVKGGECAREVLDLLDE